VWTNETMDPVGAGPLLLTLRERRHGGTRKGETLPKAPTCKKIYGTPAEADDRIPLSTGRQTSHATFPRMDLRIWMLYGFRRAR